MQRKEHAFRRSAALVAVVGLALTAGCSGGGDKAGSTTEGKTTLTFWVNSSEPFIAAHKQVIADFESANKDVRVDLQPFPFADFNTRVVASMASGQGPDVMEAYSPWMTGYIRTGLVSAVPENVLSTDKIDERYYESTLSLLGFEGTYYGLPANIAAGSTRVLLVNDDVVEKAGVDVTDNSTFEDWQADWAALTQKKGATVTRSGLGLSCGQPADQFVTYLMEYGGQMFSADGRRAAFNSAPGVQALTLLNELTGTVDSADITDFTCIPQGTAATGYRGTWVIPEYERDFPDFAWHYELMPLPPGASVTSWQGGSGWATYVPKSSKHQEAAWRFVKYLDDNRQAWIERTGEIPAAKEIAAAVAKSNPDLYGVYYPILGDSVHGYPYGDYFVVYKALSDMVTSVNLGRASVTAALKDAETAINSHLNQWWTQYP